VPDRDPTKHVHEIAELAKQQGFRVGAAESLTGGAVSSALARGEGAADWYHGSVVSYSPTVKYDLLGVTPGPLVTERCAVEMVTGAAKVLEIDAGVSTTGAGGPGPEEGQPQGTVHVAIYVRGEVTTHELHLDGDPGEVVEGATEVALGLLLQEMRAAVSQSGE
jgi:nicotinamide-nucleotide amidase